jgi:hypothetical protein
MKLSLVCAFLLLLSTLSAAYAQDNYEIQVYGSETVARGATMVESHSNFTFQGSKKTTDGTLPTNHQFHETIEITHGWNDWFETGFYIFLSEQSDVGWRWVGNHIRPRVRIPEKWHWPLGVSLSTEIGYVSPLFSKDTWTWEIRPIVDKDIGKLYLSFNPVLGRSFHGPAVAQGLDFSPNVKIGYKVIPRVAAGFEYYGTLGSLHGFDQFGEQSHQFIPAIDLDLGPNWEFNFGVGVGVTHNTEHLLIKIILGRRFGRKA